MHSIIKAHATNNLCYIAARGMVPKGIVVHSTGANNPYLKRYVDAPDAVGPNRYGNHWNVAKPDGRKVCVHAFIGYDKDGQVRVAEILPLGICCWGVGSGSKGSYNYDPAYIQFEICEDGLCDKSYYTKAFGVAAEYCAKLCKAHGISTENIVGHCEAFRLGYGCNHSDPEHWMKNFGESMDDFRNQVRKLLQDTDCTPALHPGDLVCIEQGAAYYNGKPIPSWVQTQNWYVQKKPNGDRVIIDRNESGTHAICSPIHRMHLKVVKAAASVSGGEPEFPYLVRITADCLNIRTSAGTDNPVAGTIHDRGIYTIVEESSGTGATRWRKLKSGAGWISLDHAKKI